MGWNHCQVEKRESIKGYLQKRLQKATQKRPSYLGDSLTMETCRAAPCFRCRDVFLLEVSWRAVICVPAAETQRQSLELNYQLGWRRKYTPSLYSISYHTCKQSRMRCGRGQTVMDETICAFQVHLHPFKAGIVVEDHSLLVIEKEKITRGNR